MKVRNGFVSNSSSSSFIVAFDKEPKSSEELRKMMFGNETMHEEYETSKIADCVFRSIEEQRAKRKQIESISPAMITCAEVGGDPERIIHKFLPNLLEDDSDIYWDIMDYLEKVRDDDFDDFINLHKDKIFYRFEYGDEGGGFFSMMEHSGIFDKLEYEVISHH